MEKETLQFEASIANVLDLVAKSLYSNKEIFLRELISNASDAANKLKFLALSNPNLYEDEAELKVWVEMDKDNRTITIRDNGIGMNKAEIVKNLGTIAQSGTKEFLSRLTGDNAKDSQLIGQFGVGFYSAFVVADRVTVLSRKAGEPMNQGVRWSSDGKGSYDLETISKSQRGTEIILHLKEGEDEFLNNWHVRHVITKYSDHIDLPVVMFKDPETNPEPVDETTDPSQTAQADATEANQATDAATSATKLDNSEVINKATALWTRPKQEISEQEYQDFYKHIAHDYENPLHWVHVKVEGKLDYTLLLFLPKRAPFDLWNSQKPKGLKLYVQRVFIMDNAEAFLPNYLRFVKGIVDSNDLPLNVSRELLQSNKTTDSIRSGIVSRVLNLLNTLAKDEPNKYQEFWREFGQVLKEGVIEDFANKEKVAQLLRFHSSKFNEANDQTVTLDDYISRMVDDQEVIYYLTADSLNAAKSNPQLEIFNAKEIEVLLLHDKIDEWVAGHLTEYQGKKLQCISKGDLESLNKLSSEEETKAIKEQEEQYQAQLEQVKTWLSSRVTEVKLTRRLTTSPACVVAPEHALSPHMERLMRSAGQQIPTSKPSLELNAEHLLVIRLFDFARNNNETQGQKLASMLLDQAILADGGQLDDPASFVKQFNELLLELVN